MDTCEARRLVQKNTLLKRTVKGSKSRQPLYQYLVRFVKFSAAFEDELGAVVHECDLQGNKKNVEPYPVRLSELSFKKES